MVKSTWANHELQNGALLRAHGLNHELQNGALLLWLIIRAHRQLKMDICIACMCAYMIDLVRSL